MSFDTDKNKLRLLWEKQQEDSHKIENVSIIQNRKEKQVSLTEANEANIKHFRSFHSEWMPVETVESVTNEDSGEIEIRGKSVAFTVELVLPEFIIPYARMNVAMRTKKFPENLLTSTNYITRFIQVLNDNPQAKFKKVIYNFLFYETNEEESLADDYEMKLFFTLINPAYFTAS